MIRESLRDADAKMNLALEHVSSEFSTIRTGRANPQILNRLTVDYYGSQTPLQQIAGFSVPEPRLLVVQPYDKGSIGAIERSIRESDLGLNPSNDGVVIRLVFPSLTEERRKDLIRLVRQMAEDGRVAVRNIRRSAKSDIDSLHGEVSDDDIHRAEAELQELTDRHTDKIDELLRHKEEELLEV